MKAEHIRAAGIYASNIPGLQMYAYPFNLVLEEILNKYQILQELESRKREFHESKI